MPTIELTHATKSFQQFTALNDVSLTVEAGTILKPIGYMAQEDALYEDLTGKKSLLFWANDGVRLICDCSNNFDCVICNLYFGFDHRR